MLKIKNIIRSISIAVLITSCGGGSTNSQANQAETPIDTEEFTPSEHNKKAVQGLISYDKIDARHFYAKKAINANSKLKQVNSTSTVQNCANLNSTTSNNWATASTIEGDISSVYGWASGFASLYPEAAVPTMFVNMGVTGLFSAFSTITPTQSSITSCLVQDEVIMQNEILAIESQVAHIESNITMLQSEFRNLSYQVALNQVASNQQTLNNALENFLPINDNKTLTTQLFVLSGLLNRRFNAPTGNVIESMANYVNTRLNVDDFVVSQALNFQNSVDSLSGTYIPNNCSENCFTQVQIDPNSALIQTYESLWHSVAAHLGTSYNSIYTDGSGYSRLLDDYNNTVLEIYIKSAFALNSAYMSEWLVNKMNYLAYTQGASPEFTISSLGGFNDTYYDYVALNIMNESSLSLTDNTNYYNQAQLQLNKLYAARMNALYTNMLNYIVSDAPNLQNHQLYSESTYFITLESGTNNYSTNYHSESTIAQFNTYIKQNLGLKVYSPQVLAIHSPEKAGWVFEYNRSTDSSATPYQGIFYQYGGLRSLDCLNQYEDFTIQSQNGSSPSSPNVTRDNCPAIFADVNGNSVNQGLYYPGQVIKPYMIESNLSLKLAESVTNNIAACDLNNGNLYFWHPNNSAINPMNNESSIYLTCNWWNPPPAGTPSGGGCNDCDVNGAYDYFVNAYMFPTNDFTPDPTVVPAFNPSSSQGILLWSSVNGNGQSIPMTLTAGDLTGVPNYSSNNIIMTTNNNNYYQQTVFVGNTYYGNDNIYFNSTNQPAASMGYVFNTVHPLSQGLNIPLGLGFYIKGNTFILLPLCTFNTEVLFNSSNGLVPMCDGSANIPEVFANTAMMQFYGDSPSYYGTNYISWGNGWPYTGYTNSNNLFVPTVSIFSERNIIEIFGQNFDSNQGIIPIFELNFR